MAIKVHHDYEVGNGLEYTNSKVSVKPDNTGNVRIEVSENGVKGTVELPAAFDPVTLEQKIQEAQAKADRADAKATEADTKAQDANTKNGSQDTEIEQLKAKNQELEQMFNAEKEKVSTLEGKVQALESREDIKLEGAFLNEDTNELELTLVGGTVIKTSLAKFVDAPKSAAEYLTEMKALPEFKAALVELLKGEEVQDFAGETKGFLITNA